MMLHHKYNSTNNIHNFTLKSFQLFSKNLFHSILLISESKFSTSRIPFIASCTTLKALQKDLFLSSLTAKKDKKKKKEKEKDQGKLGLQGMPSRNNLQSFLGTKKTDSYMSLGENHSWILPFALHIHEDLRRVGYFEG